MQPSEPPAEEQKTDKVYDWRVECFERLDFAGPIAHLLAASSNADLGLARKLRSQGCPSVLILKILV